MTTIESLPSQTTGRQRVRQHDPADGAAGHSSTRETGDTVPAVVNPWRTIGGALGEQLEGLLPSPRMQDSGESGRFAVHDVANALRAVLAAGEAAASGGADALLERINAGFVDADRALVAAGFDEHEARELVVRFRERLADVLAAHARSAARSAAGNTPLPTAEPPVPSEPSDAAPAGAPPLTVDATQLALVIALADLGRRSPP